MYSVHIKNIITFTMCLLISSMPGQTFASKDFIIDTDAAADDVMAILYLLNHPEIKIKAITIVGTGESHCAAALKNIYGLLEMTHQASIPVACGREKPLEGNHHFPDFLTEEADSLSHTQRLLPQTNIYKKTNSVGLLIKTLRQTSHPISILAIGPLTNIAEAFFKAPDINTHIKEIFIMGGAISVAGNITKLELENPNKTAEWNLYIDPVAANFVFKQQAPIYLIPLDLTNKFPLDINFFYKFEHEATTVVTQFILQILKNNLHWIRNQNFYFWDCLAAVIAANPGLAEFKNMKLKVIIYPENQAGTTIIDSDEGKQVLVATDMNDAKFKAEFISMLNRNALLK